MKLPKIFTRQNEKYIYWLNITFVLLIIAVSFLSLIFILQLVKPVKLNIGEIEKAFPAMSRKTGSSQLDLLSTNGRPDMLPLSIRPGLFKPAAPLRTNPVADRTIETILSKLSLKWITKINEEPVAFIAVKGTGIKKCRKGDYVQDMFTVLSVEKDSVRVSIVDHPVILQKKN